MISRIKIHSQRTHTTALLQYTPFLPSFLPPFLPSFLPSIYLSFLPSFLPSILPYWSLKLFLECPFSQRPTRSHYLNISLSHSLSLSLTLFLTLSLTLSLTPHSIPPHTHFFSLFLTLSPSHRLNHCFLLQSISSHLQIFKPFPCTLRVGQTPPFYQVLHTVITIRAIFL